MTTQTSYSEKKSKGMSRKYFLGELKRSWPKMVLYFIVFCLAMIIPLLMSDMEFTGMGLSETLDEYRLKCSRRLLNTITEYGPIWSELSMIVALFAGCYVTKILNNKISADFYHSIPMRRESIFLTRFATGAVTYLVTFLVNVLIVLVLCETQDLADGYGLMLLKQIGVNFVWSLLGFFMIYSATIFAGMLCGTTVMQLIMTLYLNLIVFVYYASAFLTLDKFFDNFNATYYLENMAVTKILPFITLFTRELRDSLTVPQICFFVIGSFLLVMASVALYRFRKIEKAGTPIVFDGFAAFFRYSVIIPVTLLGGIFFDELVGNSLVWYIVGLVIATFLCFLLVNTIIQKNARKMFTGIKGLGIYAAAMLVILLAVGFDVFGIDTYVPKADDVKSVEIIINCQINNLSFEDEDVIKAAIELDRSHGEVRSYTEEKPATVIYEEYTEITEASSIIYGDYEIIDEEVFYSNDYDKISYSVVYRLKTGIPIARRVNVMLESEQMTSLAKAVANSEEYEQFWSGMFEGTDKGYVELTYDCITESNIKDGMAITDNINYDAICEKLKKNFKGIDYEYLCRSEIGSVFFHGQYSNGYKAYETPLYRGDEFVMNWLGFDSEEEYYDHLAGEIIDIVIYKGDKSSFSMKDGTVLPRDTELYKEVLKNLTSLTDTRNIFKKSEAGYHVGIVFGSDDGYSQSVRYMSAEFLKDCVPASVSALVP